MGSGLFFPFVPSYSGPTTGKPGLRGLVPLRMEFPMSHGIVPTGMMELGLAFYFWV